MAKRYGLADTDEKRNQRRALGLLQAAIKNLQHAQISCKEANEALAGCFLGEAILFANTLEQLKETTGRVQRTKEQVTKLIREQEDLERMRRVKE